MWVFNNHITNGDNSVKNIKSLQWNFYLILGYMQQNEMILNSIGYGYGPMYHMEQWGRGRVRDTVVACWIAGQQVERLILHQGHDS